MPGNGALACDWKRFQMMQAFFSFFKENVFAIANGKIYLENKFGKKESENAIFLEDKINLAITEKRANTGKLLTKDINFLTYHFCPDSFHTYTTLYEIAHNQKPNPSGHIEDILEYAPQPCLNIKGIVYLMEHVKSLNNLPIQRHVILNKKIYNLKENGLPIETLEKRIINILRNKCAYPEEGYNEKIQIGYKTINSNLLVYIRVKSYVLYEFSNWRYYRMPGCNLGFYPYFKNGKINIGDIMVLDNYTHPALMEDGKSMQKLCVGDYDYASNFESWHENKPKEMIVAALNFAKKSLTAGYNIHARPYYLLSSPIFNRFIIEEFNREEVTNI